MKRKIIQIDEEKCNGCGACVPNCQEGALQIIDGKARLISDLFCDGLGACIGHCPEGAIEIIEREAEPYDERKVMETLVPKGRNTILAHLEHLRDHGEEELLKQEAKAPRSCGCPGGREIDFRESNRQEAGSGKAAADGMSAPSELRQWPVQLHLLNPNAAYFRDADVVLAADCVAFAMGNFHARFLKGKSIAIACPKLDSDKESYVEKLSMMISGAHINTLHVIMMEVPCCGGLLQMALEARQKAGRNIPIKKTIVSLQGEVLQEDWV